MKHHIKKLYTIHKAELKKHATHTLPVYLVQTIIGLIMSLLSVAIFFEIADHIFLKNTISIDIALSHIVYNVRNPALTQIMIFISSLGVEFTVIGAIVLVILLAFIGRRHDAVFFSFIFLTGIIVNTILKNFYQRPRPHIDQLIPLDSFSFPSFHAMNAFIFYVMVSYLVFHITHNKKSSILISLFSSCLILLVGFSRVYLGVHYPSDVIAGYVAGFFIVITALVARYMVQSTTSFFSKQ